MGQMLSEKVGYLAGGLEPLGRFLGVQLVDNRAQPVGDFRIHFADGPGYVIAYALEDGHRRVGAEGRMAGTHRIQDAAETEQVGAVIDGLAAGLLGGHVLRRAGDDARLRQAGVVHGPRQPEVGELHPLHTVFQQDVRRLDVAVDQSLSMRRGQPGRRLHADAQDLFQLQRAALIDAFLKRDAVDIFHDQVGQAIDLIDAVDVDDVFIADGGGGPRLAQKSLASRARTRHVQRHYLDGHHACSSSSNALRTTPMPPRPMTSST